MLSQKTEHTAKEGLHLINYKVKEKTFNMRLTEM
jgi:hypothetical protein